MDSYESVKFSNFTSNQKVGVSDRLNNQLCTDTLTRKEKESTLPMRYYISDFFKGNDNKGTLTDLSKGIFFNNGFGKSINNVDLDSQARIGKYSEKKMIGPLGSLPLPTTASFARGQGDTLIEDSRLRASDDHVQKSCNTKDNSYYNRHFYLFPEGIVQNPTGDVDKLVQKNASFRQGISTKGTISKKYMRGKC